MGGFRRPDIASYCRGASAAADEVDDFVAVFGLDAGGFPLDAGQNLEVALDGDTVCVQPERNNQGGHGEPGLDFMPYAVDGDAESFAHFVGV